MRASFSRLPRATSAQPSPLHVAGQLSLALSDTTPEPRRPILTTGNPPEARARRDDPGTSHAAAQRVDEFAREHQERIYAALATPGTIHELAARTGLTHVQVARRLPEMRNVHPTDDKRPSPNGRPCRVWARA